MASEEKIDISILLSGIRPANWEIVYKSIQNSFHGSWELVICTPQEPKFINEYFVKNRTNIKVIQDYGSPVRCYQICLVNAVGKYVCHIADDGELLPNALDVAFKSLEENPNSVVVGKYNEGAPNPIMDEISYYYPARHDATNVEFVPKDCLMLMEGVMPRDLMFEVGGWDAKRFECYPMAGIDLSIRLYHKGVKFIFQDEMLFKCSHMPGTLGDHAAVHFGQVQGDEPRFKLLYSLPKSQSRITIPLDNWKESPERWVRRFGIKT